jgi:hypothetical protein
MEFWALNFWGFAAWIAYKMIVPGKPAEAPEPMPAPPPSLSPLPPINPFTSPALGLPRTAPASVVSPRTSPPVSAIPAPIPPTPLAPTTAGYQWLRANAPGTLQSPLSDQTIQANLQGPDGSVYLITMGTVIVDEVGNVTADVYDSDGCPAVRNSSTISVPLAAIVRITDHAGRSLATGTQ